jgi:hypothetical protein
LRTYEGSTKNDILLKFKPDNTPRAQLDGLNEGVRPLEPSKKGIAIMYVKGRETMVCQRQLTLTAAS